MSNLVKRKFRTRSLKRRPLGLIIVILTWSLAMGWLLALATSAHSATPTAEIGTVDVIPPAQQLGQELYLENCATCHIGIPPGVLPRETWRNLLEDSQHYGVQLKPLIDPPRALVWRYLSTFSRSRLPDEEIPYRVRNSRFFKALHPKVELPRPVQINSCVTCHPGTTEYNYRRLSSEWEK